MTDAEKRDDEVRAAIASDLTKRLRPVCAQWPDDLFDAMVERLTDITLRYEDRATAGTYDRRTTDRLVSELKEALERSEHIRHSGESGPDTSKH